MCLNIHILYKGEFMRYYIYLDRVFIRTLFAVLDDFDFDIDIVEYAVRKSYTNNNEISVDPSVDNGNTHDTFKEIDKPACVAGAPVEENVVPATCWVDGKKDIVTYCVNCGDELSRQKHVVIPTR